MAPGDENNEDFQDLQNLRKFFLCSTNLSRSEDLFSRTYDLQARRFDISSRTYQILSLYKRYDFVS